MPTYSIAQAKDHFARLVDEAASGDDVKITRHGKVVAEVRAPAPAKGKRPSKALLKRIFDNAAKRPPLGESAVDIIRRMRDGETD